MLAPTTHLFCCPCDETFHGRSLRDGFSVVMYTATDVETVEDEELVSALDAAQAKDPTKAAIMWSYIAGLQIATLETVESEHAVDFGGDSFAALFPPSATPERIAGRWIEVAPENVARLGPVIAHDATYPCK